MRGESSLGRERRLCLSRRELACAAALAAAATPVAWNQTLRRAFRARFGAERAAPSRTVEAFVVRCLRRGLRARLRRSGLVPEGASRGGWRLGDDPTWAAVHEHQAHVFAAARAVLQRGVLRHVAARVVHDAVAAAMSSWG